MILDAWIRKRISTAQKSKTFIHRKEDEGEIRDSHYDPSMTLGLKLFISKSSSCMNKTVYIP